LPQEREDSGPVLELPVKLMLVDIGSSDATGARPVKVVGRLPATGDEITAVTPEPALVTAMLCVREEVLVPNCDVAVIVTE